MYKMESKEMSRRLLALLLLISVSFHFAQSVILKENNHDETLFMYREHIKEVYRLLTEECSSYIEDKRELKADAYPHELQIAKNVYTRWLHRLIECRKLQSSRNGSSTTRETTQDTTETMIRSTTTVQAATTDIQLHLKECSTASNLTDNQRLVHVKTNSSRSGYLCDLRTGLQWFRFAKGAGNADK